MPAWSMAPVLRKSSKRRESPSEHPARSPLSKFPECFSTRSSRNSCESPRHKFRNPARHALRAAQMLNFLARNRLAPGVPVFRQRNQNEMRSHKPLQKHHPPVIFFPLLGAAYIAHQSDAFHDLRQVHSASPTCKHPSTVKDFIPVFCPEQAFLLQVSRFT